LELKVLKAFKNMELLVFKVVLPIDLSEMAEELGFRGFSRLSREKW